MAARAAPADGWSISSSSVLSDWTMSGPASGVELNSRSSALSEHWVGQSGGEWARCKLQCSRWCRAGLRVRPTRYGAGADQSTITLTGRRQFFGALHALLSDGNELLHVVLRPP